MSLNHLSLFVRSYLSWPKVETHSSKIDDEEEQKREEILDGTYSKTDDEEEEDDKDNEVQPVDNTYGIVHPKKE